MTCSAYSRFKSEALLCKFVPQVRSLIVNVDCELRAPGSVSVCTKRFTGPEQRGNADGEQRQCCARTRAGRAFSVSSVLHLSLHRVFVMYVVMSRHMSRVHVFCMCQLITCCYFQLSVFDQTTQQFAECPHDGAILKYIT